MAATGKGQLSRVGDSPSVFPAMEAPNSPQRGREKKVQGADARWRVRSLKREASSKEFPMTIG